MTIVEALLIVMVGMILRRGGDGEGIKGIGKEACNIYFIIFCLNFFVVPIMKSILKGVFSSITILCYFHFMCTQH